MEVLIMHQPFDDWTLGQSITMKTIKKILIELAQWMYIVEPIFIDGGKEIQEEDERDI